MGERQQFVDNKVLLWGEKKASKKLLDEFDHGNKNPRSINKTKEKKPDKKETKTTTKKANKRVFDNDETYGYNDLDFLNEEYDRIDDLLADTTDMNKFDELSELQEQINDKIEEVKKKQLEADEDEDKQSKEASKDKWKEVNKLNDKIDKLREEYIASRGNPDIKAKIESLEMDVIKLMKGGAIKKPIIKTTTKPVSINQINFNPKYNSNDVELVGKGYKKGSPEALAHAEKMRLARETKKKPIVEKEVKRTKSRVVKGSQEAKALAQRLLEARKKKLEAKKAEEEEKKKKEELLSTPKGKPWFYIGDIPSGYREATEDEALSNNKVSEYGKYVVNHERYVLMRDYNVLLVYTKTPQEIVWTMNGLKRRIMTSLKEIEIIKNKIEGNKVSKELGEQRLENEKTKRKNLQAGYNWYGKLLAMKQNTKYVKQKFKLEKPKEIKITKGAPEYKPVEVIDPRTKEKIVYDTDKLNAMYNNFNKDVVSFKRGKDIISLKKKYFDNDGFIKSKYASKLFDKNIVLDKNLYKHDDYIKFTYIKI